MMLLSGCVKITLLGLSGREVILRLIGTGELVGDIQLSANGKHFSTAKAVQSSLALVWDVTAFENLLDRFPTFRHNMVRGLEDRLREMEQRFREVSTENVEPRVSSELIRLSNRFGCSENGHKEIHLSRGELAQLTGTTQSTISRLLSRWQRLGIVSIHRETVRVCNSCALAQLTLNE
jgi:CRP/FNR family transcriptional regulator, nitrogen oxide reductase regulator